MVSEVHPSADGLVRKVKVAYKIITDDCKVNIYKGLGYTFIERPVHSVSCS